MKRVIKYVVQIIIFLIIILCAEVFQPLNTIFDAYEKLSQNKLAENERITIGPDGEHLIVGFKKQKNN